MPITSTPNDVTEAQLRAIAHNTLIEWFENEVYLGREQYADGKTKRAKQVVDIPEDRVSDGDQLADAKKKRPWLWTTKHRRKFTAYDGEGKEIELVETLSILDTFGRGPAPSRNSQTSKVPDGRNFIDSKRLYSSGEKVQMRRRLDYMKRVHMAMRHLDHFAPMYMICLRWYLAGMSIEGIANKLTKLAKTMNSDDKVAKGSVEKYIEAAITWVMGCMMENPIWREYEPEFREVLKQHIAEEKDQSTETIWG